jgi:Xaa-Pro aminopeptidase
MTTKEVQAIAKDTMEAIGDYARSGMSEKELAAFAKEYMTDKGIVSYWYHEIPALLFAGERTVLSLPASEYVPSEYKVKDDDIITIDLSPEVDRVWSDYARTIILQDGRTVKRQNIRNSEFREGLNMEDKLHDFLVESARPDMIFSELHDKIDKFLKTSDYENLDFLNNFGHTIVEDFPTGTFFELKNDGRFFFDANCQEKLTVARYFTFEPHIRKKGGKYGYKREDIYTFESGRLTAI